MKIRTIITQDAEVDDRNSLRHFLFYANEVEVQGIVQTSSKFHWRGVPGAVRPEKRYRDDFEEIQEVGAPFDQPYRWPGTAALTGGELTAEGDTARVTVPSAAPGSTIHVIVKAESAGHFRLTHYQQVIITVL